jgi:hypothetical protein
MDQAMGCNSPKDRMQVECSSLPTTPKVLAANEDPITALILFTQMTTELRFT